MTDQLISFETARLAKEKGFKEQTVQMYNDKGKLAFWTECTILAPTQSLLQRWLREEHGIDICILPYAGPEISYGYIIYIDDKEIRKVEPWSYEKALEQGLQEALKLIEI
jgi:hypothetical protein